MFSENVFAFILNGFTIFEYTFVKSQPSKAYAPIVVTLLGIVTEVRLIQPEKALSPILVTLLGIVTEVRPLQPQKT